MSTTAARIMTLFLDALAAEQGASANTLAAYARDLTGFCDWLEGQLADAGNLR